MNKIEVAQTILKKFGSYTGNIDGNFGQKSMNAAKEYYDFDQTWKNDRLAIGVLQVYATRNNIPTGPIDGFWGRNTELAYGQILELLDIKSSPSIEVDQNVVVKPSYNNWPTQNYNELVRYFGDVGTNQTSLLLPYKMKLAWDLDTSVSKITCNAKVKDSLDRIFKNTVDHYGMDAIRELHLDHFGGCLNVRKMRGGSSWSMHSWGIAVDLDPDRNRLRWGRDKAVFAKKEYDPFWKIVEAEGGVSLGRERNYDWMHFQFAKL